MKKIFYITMLFMVQFVWAQEEEAKPKRFFFQGEASFTIPNEKNAKMKKRIEDNRYTGGYYTRNIELDEAMLFFSDFSANYQLFRKLSVGGLVGLAHFSTPSDVAFKVGGVVRFNVMKTSPANIFFQAAGFLPLTSVNSMEASMGEVRFGLSIPLMVRKRVSMHLSMYVTRVGFDMKGENPAVPDEVEYKGFGFGYGVRF